MPDTFPTCSIEGCPGRAHTRGFCTKHYSKWRRYGDPLVVKRQKGRVCSVDDCEQPLRSRGFCERHYANWRRHGSPHAPTSRRPYNMTETEFADWFHKQFLMTESGCLEWQGSKDELGYASVWYNGHVTDIHRVAWTLAYGEPTQNVLHSCDNPPCCLLEHLRLGTQAENVQDRVDRERSASKLTREQAQIIRREYASGGISQASLGRKYGVSDSTIRLIVRNKIWQDPQT